MNDAMYDAKTKTLIYEISAERETKTPSQNKMEKKYVVYMKKGIDLKIYDKKGAFQTGEIRKYNTKEEAQDRINDLKREYKGQFKIELINN
jgi:hypothetical protein